MEPANAELEIHENSTSIHIAKHQFFGGEAQPIF